MISSVMSALALLFLLGLLIPSAALELAASSCQPGERFDGNTGGCVPCPPRPSGTDSEWAHYANICRKDPTCGCSDPGAGGSAIPPSHKGAPPAGVDNAGKASNKKDQGDTGGDTGVGGGDGSDSRNGGDIGAGGGGPRNASDSDTKGGGNSGHTWTIVLGILAALAIIGLVGLVAYIRARRRKSQECGCHQYRGVSTDVERGDEHRTASVGVIDGVAGSSGGSGSSNSEGGEGSSEGGVPSRPLPEPPAVPSVSVNTDAIPSQDGGPDGSPLSDNPQSGTYPRDGTYDSAR